MLWIYSIDSTKINRILSKVNISSRTDETILSEVINMDTDEDESEIDDGEEEERVTRRFRCIQHAPNHKGIIPTTQMNANIDIEKKKQPKIELKLPSTLNSSRVCYFLNYVRVEVSIN